VIYYLLVSPPPPPQTLVCHHPTVVPESITVPEIYNVPTKLTSVSELFFVNNNDVNNDNLVTCLIVKRKTLSKPQN
jgi:hypothetical protein